MTPMTLLDLTWPTPQENLACDEALLEACEQDASREVLRFWEPREHFVVLGYSSRIAADVKLPACRRLGVPLYRRMSGGGTVLQGPGCLNYTLVLRQDRHPELATITGTTAWILERHRAALSRALRRRVRLAGQSDLVIGDVKCSGNAQRRLRHSVLFHGTFLLDLDLLLMSRVLTNPPRQPAYRARRGHRSFVANLGVPASRIKQALARAWGAQQIADSSGDTLEVEGVPGQFATHVRQLAEARYADQAWIHRFA